MGCGPRDADPSQPVRVQRPQFEFQRRHMGDMLLPEKRSPMGYGLSNMYIRHAGACCYRKSRTHVATRIPGDTLPYLSSHPAVRRCMRPTSGGATSASWTSALDVLCCWSSASFIRSASDAPRMGSRRRFKPCTSIIWEDLIPRALRS
eukprot:4669625-Prymnesium_polylepis.3